MAKTSYLPPEITEIILLKSSVKPLLRFKSVSKSWYALISDPLFLKNHHQISKSSNSQDLFVCDLRYSNVFTVVKLEDQKLEIVQELESPYGCNYVICHCKGVLLLADGSFRRHVLWNPSTRTQTQLRLGAISGLCHDPATDDFKVVIVDRDYYSVFSCKYRFLIIWRKKFNDPYIGRGLISKGGGVYVDGTNIGLGLMNKRTGVCVDGAIYWVWSLHNVTTLVSKNVTELIYYDTRDDKFKILEKPKNVCERKMIFLVDLGGFLCLFCQGRDKTRVKLWIKGKGIDNNSWNHLITIENVKKMDIQYFEPQCLMGNKIVIRNTYADKLVVYNPFEKTFEQFEDTELKCYHPGLIPYLDCQVDY